MTPVEILILMMMTAAAVEWTLDGPPSARVLAGRLAWLLTLVILWHVAPALLAPLAWRGTCRPDRAEFRQPGRRSASRARVAGTQPSPPRSRRTATSYRRED